MVLWNFALPLKNYGTMEKIWYHGKNYGTIPINYGTSITKEKNMVDDQKN